MKKAGKDERVWLVLRNIILLCGLILILFPYHKKKNRKCIEQPYSFLKRIHEITQTIP